MAPDRSNLNRSCNPVYRCPHGWYSNARIHRPTHTACRDSISRWRLRTTSGSGVWLGRQHSPSAIRVPTNKGDTPVRYSAWFASAILCASACHAQVILPPAPVNSSAPADEVRAKDGTSCRNSSDGPIADFGVTSGNDSQIGLPGFNLPTERGTAIYGRVVVPIGDRPRKLDCNFLYQIELERLQLELDRMRRESDVRIRVE